MQPFQPIHTIFSCLNVATQPKNPKLGSLLPLATIPFSLHRPINGSHICRANAPLHCSASLNMLHSFKKPIRRLVYIDARTQLSEFRYMMSLPHTIAPAQGWANPVHILSILLSPPAFTLLSSKGKYIFISDRIKQLEATRSDSVARTFRNATLQRRPREEYLRTKI